MKSDTFKSKPSDIKFDYLIPISNLLLRDHAWSESGKLLFIIYYHFHAFSLYSELSRNLKGQNNFIDTKNSK